MMKKISVLASFFLLLTASMGLAQTFSIEGSVAYALKHSPVLKGGKFEIQKAEDQIKSERGRFLPSFSAGYSLRDITSEHSDGVADSDYVDKVENSGSIRLTQSIFSGFEYTNRFKRAKLEKEYQQAQFTAKKLDLIYRVKSTFLQLMKRRHDISIINKRIERLEEDLALAKAYSQRKLAPYSHVLQAEADLEFEKQQLWKAKIEVERIILRLNLLLGIPKEQSAAKGVQYNDSIESLTWKLDHTLDFYLDYAMKHRVEPNLIRVQIQMAQKDANIFKGKYLPRVDVRAGLYGVNSNYDNPSRYGGDQDQENVYWDTGLFVTWDLFDGGTNYYSSRRLLSEIKRLETDLLQIRLEIEEDVSFAYKSILEAQARIKSTEKALAAAKENYTREQKRFRARIATTSDVLDAHAKLVRAEVESSQVFLDFQTALAELSFATGQMEGRSDQNQSTKSINGDG